MRRRDWWLGIAAVVLAVLLHALIPRYEWRSGPTSATMTRTDRWTGRADLMRLWEGRWVTVTWLNPPAPR